MTTISTGYEELTVERVMQWLSQQDPQAELVFAFLGDEGVVWRHSHELGFELYADAWFDAEGDRVLPVIEIDVRDELIVESAQ